MLCETCFGIMPWSPCTFIKYGVECDVRIFWSSSLRPLTEYHERLLRETATHETKVDVKFLVWHWELTMVTMPYHQTKSQPRNIRVWRENLLGFEPGTFNG